MSITQVLIGESIAQALLAEFDTQAPVTRRFLERLPEDRLTWKPHEKSMTAGQLAYHIAATPGGVARFVQTNPAQAPDFKFPQPVSVEEILRTFSESVTVVREILPTIGLFLRDVMFSHVYQHRGQFAVYLRMLNIPVPASWGPSADEPPLFMQR
jgi:uncharacterized damage-inducible protein DinB